MKVYEATEAAYKNGYAKGYEDGKRDAVVHGQWLEYPTDLNMKCSVCGTEYLKAHMPCVVGWCPNPSCGAKMDGDKHE